MGERRANKKKLSRNLLDMGFMREREREREIQDEEDIRSQMFDSEVTPAMRASGSRVIIEPSYVPVENLVFGRLAFKGMNSEIEAMMSAAEAAKEESIKQEMDVSDMEMSTRLAQNMAKKFAKKRDSAGKPSITKNLAGPNSETSSLLAQTSAFLSQVRAESDQAKKAKPNFLKPQDD